MGETTLYVDDAYCILMGREPDAAMSRKARMIAVMQHWDGRKFDGDRLRETIAKMALCKIGLAWHSSECHTLGYPFSLVAGRLLEFMPELGTEEISGRTLLDILTGRHSSQYPGKKKAGDG